MKISLNWLKDYVEFDKKLSSEDIAWRITEATAEIEVIHDLGKDLDKVVVGKVLKLEKHPDADKLQVCQVSIGKEEVTLVCGGTNLREGMNVAISLPGAMVQFGEEGDLTEVKEVKIRGVKSHGMICGAEEIGLAEMFPLAEDRQGLRDILDLSDQKVTVGDNLADALNLDDKVFEIDNHSITHRSDLFSHIGFARECVALGLAKWKEPFKTKPASKFTGKQKLPVKPEFADKGCSKNYFSTVITGLSTKESPLWLKSRLNAVGIRSINAIVDITNLIMMEVGQPLHAFDLRLIEGKKFQHRLSKEGEQLTTLDGMKRKLDKDIIIVESGGEIVDLCGVMGAENSAIKDDTTAIYLHCCHYDNVLIRKAMISLGHRTDAGTIFEKDLEPERAETGFSRALEAFKDVFPEAKMGHEVFHHQEAKSKPEKITLPFDKMNRHLGLEILPKDAKKYLEDLGFTVTLKKDSLVATVPTWRVNDVSIPEDLIEEVVRIHGLSKVPATAPDVELSTPVKNHKRHLKRTIQKFLTGQGFLEEVNFSFLSEDLLSKMGISDLTGLIEIANPVNVDFRYMRPNFLPYMLQNLKRNQLAEPQLWKTFEMGAAYTRVEREVVEKHHLTLLISIPKKDSSFLIAKGVIESLFAELSFDLHLSAAEDQNAYPGRCLGMSSQDRQLGHLYELRPMLAESFKLKGSVSVIEINLDELYQIHSEETLYEQINRQPRALLDLSVVVDESMPLESINSVIQNTHPEYLEKSELIDLYQGENLGEGKKSFTFALSYQHPERTLEEKEIQDILDKLIAALEKAGGTVRR